MRDSRPQLLNILLNDHTTPGSSLKNIQQRAMILSELHRIITEILPNPLACWCRVANFRQGILVLETANASWMMRLRHEQSNLLSALRAQILPALSAIDIRINPSLTIPESAHPALTTQTSVVPDYSVNKREHPLAIKTLSRESAIQLQLLANHCPPKLKEKLERLIALAGESTSTTHRMQNMPEYKKQ